MANKKIILIALLCYTVISCNDPNELVMNPSFELGEQPTQGGEIEKALNWDKGLGFGGLGEFTHSPDLFDKRYVSSGGTGSGPNDIGVPLNKAGNVDERNNLNRYAGIYQTTNEYGEVTFSEQIRVKLMEPLKEGYYIFSGYFCIGEKMKQRIIGYNSATKTTAFPDHIDSNEVEISLSRGTAPQPRRVIFTTPSIIDFVWTKHKVEFKITQAESLIYDRICIRLKRHWSKDNHALEQAVLIDDISLSNYCHPSKSNR